MLGRGLDVTVTMLGRVTDGRVTEMRQQCDGKCIATACTRALHRFVLFCSNRYLGPLESAGHPELIAGAHTRKQHQQ
jgi:hypothetical protein